MCVIVDANTLSIVFNNDLKAKEQFEPVLNWVLQGKGKFIIGGTKYMNELKKVNKALNFLTMLKMRTKDKVIILPDVFVDKIQKEIEAKVSDPDFDDPHLPAMVIVSRCMVICSLDARSVDFVTMPKLYPKGVKVPRYYTGLQNTDLLSDKYIDDRYKPLSKMSLSNIEKFKTDLANTKTKKHQGR